MSAQDITQSFAEVLKQIDDILTSSGWTAVDRQSWSLENWQDCFPETEVASQRALHLAQQSGVVAVEYASRDKEKSKVLAVMDLPPLEELFAHELFPGYFRDLIGGVVAQKVRQQHNKILADGFGALLGTVLPTSTIYGWQQFMAGSLNAGTSAPLAWNELAPDVFAKILEILYRNASSMEQASVKTFATSVFGPALRGKNPGLVGATTGGKVLAEQAWEHFAKSGPTRNNGKPRTWKIKRRTTRIDPENPSKRKAVTEEHTVSFADILEPWSRYWEQVVLPSFDSAVQNDSASSATIKDDEDF